MIHYKDGVTSEGLDPELLEMLEELNLPILITSARRNGTGTSSHNIGLAVDIRVDSGRQRFNLIQAAVIAGFTRIGIYDKHIHLDIDENKDQDVSWLGKSR